MKVKDLLEELEGIDLDLDVVVVADHGQTPMKAYCANIEYVQDTSEYMMESVDEEELDEYPNAEKVFVIGG
jgi:hypothetical protein